MSKRISKGLVDIFTTARDENLYAARENFEYIYKNGGYSLEKLSIIFRQALPVIKWDRSTVRRFLYPELAEEKGVRVGLLSATPKQITNFLKVSINLRNIVQNELLKAEAMINDARIQWGQFADHPPQRQTIIDSIRENFRYVHENGGHTFEQIAILFKEACPQYAWNKSAVRRFIYPEKSTNTNRDVNMIHGSPEMLSNLLKISIDERTRVTNNLLISTHSPEP